MEIETEAKRIRSDLFELRFPHPELDADTSRCQIVGRSGQRCSGISREMSCFCNEHARLVYGCELGNSSIPGAGLGLFASRDFEEGETIDLFCGKVYPMGAQRRQDDTYMFGVENQYIADAKGTQSCISRYINHHEERDNCLFRRLSFPGCRHRHVAVFALYPIRRGEELFIDYGPGGHGERFGA
jgi:hypothetical protein